MIKERYYLIERDRRNDVGGFVTHCNEIFYMYFRVCDVISVLSNGLLVRYFCTKTMRFKANLQKHCACMINAGRLSSLTFCLFGGGSENSNNINILCIIMY